MLEKDYYDTVFIPEHIYEKMCYYLDCDDIQTMGIS